MGERSVLENRLTAQRRRTEVVEKFMSPLEGGHLVRRAAG